MKRTPVYFFAHGGPTLFEDVRHPAYTRLQELGKEITSAVKPTAVIVVSAHWQAEPAAVEVNTARTQDLIYDFFGFPRHYYELEYPNVGSPELAGRVLSTLRQAGIRAEGVKRGFDHGVFIPFTVAFNPATNPLNVPIVQVSLYDNDEASAHHALGRALLPFRDEGVVIITSGMVVHNLRDLMRGMRSSQPLPYSVTFDKAVKEAAESKVEEREASMAGLLTRSDSRTAHPTFEHLLPLHVAAGAAGDDAGKQVWTLPQGSTSWAMYRFGTVSA